VVKGGELDHVASMWARRAGLRAAADTIAIGFGAECPKSEIRIALTLD